MAISRVLKENGSGDNDCFTTGREPFAFYGVNASCTGTQTNGQLTFTFRMPSGEWLPVPLSVSMANDPNAGSNSKDVARAVARSMAMPAEQLGAVLRAIQRSSTQAAIDVVRQGTDAVVRVTRKDGFGYQVIESVVREDGTKDVTQLAYDDAGNLIHYDPKTP